MTIVSPQILISSSQVVIDRAKGETPLLKNLVKDQLLNATVLRTLSGREALLMINGQQVTAKTFLPLQTGQNLLLKVEQTGLRQVLKFMGRAEDAQGGDQRILMGSFGKARPYVMLSQLLDGITPAAAENEKPQLSERLIRFKSLASALSVKAGIPAERFLQRLLSGSGLLWESKLAAAILSGKTITPESVQSLIDGDLKGLALQLQSDAAMPGAMSEQLKGFVAGLEQHQLVNQQLLDNTGRFLLSVPVQWPSTLKFGQLLLDLGSEKESGGDRENKVIAISFLLSLSQLGDLRADFSVFKKEVAGVFGTVDEEVRTLISSCLPELKEKLQAHGFVVHDVSCRLLAPEQLTEMDLVSRAVSPSSDGFLNLVV